MSFPKLDHRRQHGFLSCLLAQISHSGKSSCHIIRTPRQPCGEVWWKINAFCQQPAKNQDHQPQPTAMGWTILEMDPAAPADILTSALGETLSQKQQATPLLDSWPSEIINVCYFKQLGFEVICYTVIDHLSICFPLSFDC